MRFNEAPYVRCGTRLSGYGDVPSDLLAQLNAGTITQAQYDTAMAPIYAAANAANDAANAAGANAAQNPAPPSGPSTSQMVVGAVLVALLTKKWMVVGAVLVALLTKKWWMP